MQQISRTGSPVTYFASRSLALAAMLIAPGACQETAPATTPSTLQASLAGTPPGMHLQYGTPVKVGEGKARSYIVLKDGVPLEIGVAMDERALDGLPAPNPEHGEHGDAHEYLLPMPPSNASPYKFVELDWNPKGHGFPHLQPHFDFHFNRISVAERNGIVPSDPQWAAKAGNLPGAEFMPAGYVSSHVLVGAPPEAVAVPRMGLHWVDLSSPELPPTLAPFTTTFIIGSWNGQVIFEEPMITRAFIATKRDTTITVPVAAKYTPAGYYPAAYRIRWDEQAKEYRIALTDLAWRQ